MANTIEGPRKVLIIPGRGPGPQPGGFKYNSLNLYSLLRHDLDHANVEHDVLNTNWTYRNIPEARLDVLLRIRYWSEDEPEKTVKVALIGDDLGGTVAYKSGANSEKIDRVVAISTRVNPTRGLLPRLQHLPPEKLSRRNAVPLNKGVELLTIFPVHDPEIALDEGTFLDDSRVETVVHPFQGSHYDGIEAILSHPKRRREIVAFVTAESDTSETN